MPARQVPIGDLELSDEIGGLRREIGMALGSRLAGFAEHSEERRIERAQEPVHPALDQGAIRRVCACELRPVGRGQVPQNSVRFPDRELTIDKRRNLGVGIKPAIGIGLGVVELAPVILAHVGQAELFQHEDDLLDVSRGLAAEQAQHGVLHCNDSNQRFSAFALVRNASVKAAEASIVCFIAP